MKEFMFGFSVVACFCFGVLLMLFFFAGDKNFSRKKKIFSLYFVIFLIFPAISMLVETDVFWLWFLNRIIIVVAGIFLCIYAIFWNYSRWWWVVLEFLAGVIFIVPSAMDILNVFLMRLFV